MTALLLAPHNDDETLFASFLILEHLPRVIVCLRSQVQQDRYGITAAAREAETAAALVELDAGYGDPARSEQWPILDRQPDWSDVHTAMVAERARTRPEAVFAPAVEDDGHEQHNWVGSLAVQVFGADRVTAYLTYTRSGGRSSGGAEVAPEPDWIGRKHRALACYRSQIAEPSCRPWFLGDLREYVAA